MSYERCIQISYHLIKKSYGSNHVLLRLLENWKKNAIMDLSKAFDCISHDLLSARLHMHSYLKGRK